MTAETETWLGLAPPYGSLVIDPPRGYMHAARVLDLPARETDRPALRCALAKSLLERDPSELVCRLVAAVMVGATLDELTTMELDA